MAEPILVIGAGGFIGRHLVRALSESGEHVIAATRSDPDFRLTNVETHIVGLSKPEDFDSLIADSRVIVHLASTSTPSSTSGRPIVELQENLRLSLALLQALQRRPETKLIYLSSGGSLYSTGQNESADEDSPLAPRSYHGAGKIAAEYFISAWCSQYSASATVLRPSNIFGPGQPERPGFGVIPTALGKILRQEPMTVWGDGSAVRDYLYIDDFVALCLAIIRSPARAGTNTVNAASSTGVSLNELFAAMESITGQRLQRNYQTSRAVDADRVVMNASKARQSYSWSPKISLHEGLMRTWASLTSTPR